MVCVCLRVYARVRACVCACVPMPATIYTLTFGLIRQLSYKNTQVSVDNFWMNGTPFKNVGERCYKLIDDIKSLLKLTTDAARNNIIA